MVDNSDRQQIVNMADQDYTYTEQLGLALYGDETPADFRNGHNFNMRELDKDYSQIKAETADAVEKSTKALGYFNQMNVQSDEDAANLKKAVDDNTTRSTASKNQLAALDIDSVQDAQNRLADINEAHTNSTNNLNALTALTAETPAKASVLLSRIRQQKKIVLFGDSWTTMHGGTMATELGAVKNYGVGGATIQTVANQVTTAMADTSVDRNTITHVVVVAGVNNVHSNNPVELSEAYSTFTKIKEAYPYAEVHYYPNNSRTWNQNRNDRFNTLIRGAAYAGAQVHPSFLRIAWQFNFSWYGGTDASGVLHLSKDGTVNFTRYMKAVLDGGASPYLGGEFNTPIYTPAQSHVTVTGSINIKFSDTDVLIRGSVKNITWKSTTTDAQKLAPVVAFGVSNANVGDVCPIALSCPFTQLYFGNYGTFMATVDYNSTDWYSVFRTQMPTRSSAYDFSGGIAYNLHQMNTPTLLI